jgi:hypothetical protein
MHATIIINNFKFKSMKHFKRMLVIGVLMGFAIAGSAQALPDVTVTAVRYKYLSAVNNKELAQPVKTIERRAAQYNIKNSAFYDDDYDIYYVSFFIPSGYILAAYDKDGKLLRTAEKHENTALPPAVSAQMKKSYPGWKIASDVYLVNYQEESGANKVWKILLEKGDMRFNIKTNEKGVLIE